MARKDGKEGERRGAEEGGRSVAERTAESVRIGCGLQEAIDSRREAGRAERQRVASSLV